MGVIFLAGVHGVGKGFLGAKAANALGIYHLTASQLIREEKGQATWTADKKTSDLDDNQLALIRAVSRRRQSHSSILLDGHFVLRNGNGVLTPLESNVFKELHLDGVVLLVDETNVIASRLALRDNVQTDLGAMYELAEAESSHARTICDELKLPFIEIYKPNEVILADSIKQLLIPR